MITIRVKGDYNKTEGFFKKIKEKRHLKKLQQCADKGVEALALATPVDTGKTASSWGYEIIQEDGVDSIIWENTNVNKHVNIATILDSGHATRNGGYVAGRNYISPAIDPVIDEFAEDAWGEVTKE